ncbi:MAG: guanylate kinase [Acidobacteriaceae bacterium]
MSGLVFIISAPSGSGKSTLVGRILSLVPGLDFSVSYTTRPPRGSESNGREYYYVSRAEFERMIREGAFLEHADVFGDYYGTARRFLDEAHGKGRDLLLDIDVQGAEQVRQCLPQQMRVSIFILPPDRTTLEKRLKMRSSAENMRDQEKIRRRLQTATREIEKYREYDYILVNDVLESSTEALKAIILTERRKHAGGEPSAEEREMQKLADACRLANVHNRIQPILASFAPESAIRK